MDGPELGRLLVETGVPVLVLNACRSAHAEAPSSDAETGEQASAPPSSAPTDPHRQVRAWGSWNKARAAPHLAQPPENLDAMQRGLIRSFAASLHELGEIQREAGRSECVAQYEESLHLFEQIGEQQGAAACAFNLGHAYKNLTDIRDLVESERWYRRSLDLQDPGDRLGKGKCTLSLGNVALERFKKAKAATKSDQEIMPLLSQAVRLFHQALALLPEDAVAPLAVVHNELGYAYGEAGDLDRALPHYQNAIRIDEASGNLFQAAQVRSTAAADLARVGRFAEALAYERRMARL